MPAFPPSRDRLARPVDISALLDGSTRRVGLMVDEPGLHWAGLSGHSFGSVSVRGGDARGSGSAGSPVGFQRAAVGHGQSTQRRMQAGLNNRTPSTTTRQGSARGRGRLPSWYPRTPLRDITSIVRAIDRRRAELGRNQDTTPQEERDSAAAAEADNALPESDTDASTPIPIATVKPQSSLAIEIFKPKPGDADWSRHDSDLLTPQKKLLNSIDKVREVWLKEQRKLERTPGAKKAERDKKVRVLMSMR